MNKIGSWNTDYAGLPFFEYTGEIPYSAKPSNGCAVKLPDDPWFLLGNYRLTLFTHISGEYELITGERSWGRLNQGAKRNSGDNSAKIYIDGEELTLTGMKSLAADTSVCKRFFGCGFALYSYNVNGAEITRRLSVKPSAAVNDGNSAFLLEVTVRNNSQKAMSCRYIEAIGANYEEIQFQAIPNEYKKVHYEKKFFCIPEINTVCKNHVGKQGHTH